MYTFFRVHQRAFACTIHTQIQACMQFFKPWYSACEKLIVENHVGHRCRNFEKEFWKIEHVRLFLVKHNSIFGTGYYNKKIQHFSSYRHFIYNIFYKNPEEKKLLNNLAKYLFITSQQKPAQSHKNNIRAKGDDLSVLSIWCLHTGQHTHH